MQLPFAFLFLTPAVLSSLVPDRHGSSSRLKPRADITIRPTDPNNAEAVEIYDMDLVALYGDKVQRQGEGADLVWKIAVPDEEVEMLKQYDGLTVEGGTDQTAPLVRVKRQDTPPAPANTVTYMAAPNGDNTAAVNAELRTFLEGKVSDKALIQDLTLDDKLLLWGGLSLTPEAKAEVEADPRIAKPLREDVNADHFRVLQDDRRRNIAVDMYNGIKAQVSDMKRSIVKRATTWKKQDPAQVDMLQDSRFPGAPINIKGFVYDAKAGEGIFIYVIDSGVEPKVDNKDPKFPDGDPERIELNVVPKEEILQTSASKAKGQEPDNDSSEPDPNAKPLPSIGSHGTMVATKAAGKRYGMAKKATIVPVKVVPSEFDIIVGVNMAFQDIKQKNRGRNSVIVMSLGAGINPTTRDECLADPTLKTIMTPIQGLHELGVPIVLAAGNFREEKNGQVLRDVIDSFPQVLENGDDVPIINVGAYASGPADHGSRLPFSQGGDQLSVYAPGKNIFAPKKDSNRAIFSGTSVAAPVVGGIIATILSMDEADQPEEIRGKEGLERVKGIRNLVKGDKYSWEHKEGQTPKVNCIWTGALQKDHDSAQPACAVNSKNKRQDGSCAPPTTVPTTEPTPTPTDPPQPPPTEPPQPTAEGHCKVSQQGLGGGQYEISGKNWPNRDTLEANLKSQMGDDGFEYKTSGANGEEFVAHTLSGSSPDDMFSKLQGIIKDLAKIDVTCDR